MSKKQQLPKIIFFTGASGAGKTALVTALRHELSHTPTAFLHFDSIGVPAEGDMIKTYGSGKEWQKQMTFNWVKKLVDQSKNKKLVIFEGQTDLMFIAEAFATLNFTQYQIILVHCDTITRHHRLYANRKQVELISTNMDNWAEYLYKQAIGMDVPIMNTTHMNIEEMVNWCKQKFALS